MFEKYEELNTTRNKLVEQLKRLDEQMEEEADRIGLDGWQKPVYFVEHEGVHVVISECDCCDEVSLTMIDEELNKIQVPLELVEQLIEDYYGS